MISFLLFCVFTLTSLVTTSYYIGESFKKSLKKDWSQYRCNPLYMPLAGYVGENVSTNFFNCLTKSFSDYAGLSMDGMNSQMGIVGDVLGSLNESVNDMRGMMGSTRGGFMMVFQSVFGKLSNLMGSMQYLMIRIKTLIGRIVGVFATIIYSSYGILQTGEAAWNNEVIQTIRKL